MLLKKRQKELLNTPLFRKLPVEEATKTKEYAKKEEGGEKKTSPQGREIPRRQLHSQAHTEAGQRLRETELGEDGRGRLPAFERTARLCEEIQTTG